MSGYRVRFWDGPMPGHVGVEPVLPTPMLLSEGHKRVEAYEMTPAGWGASGDGAAVWRMRDDSYDPPGTVYRKVTVERVPDRWQCEHCGREWVDYDERQDGLFGKVGREFLEHECDYNLEGGLA